MMHHWPYTTNGKTGCHGKARHVTTGGSGGIRDEITDISEPLIFVQNLYKWLVWVMS